MSEAFDACLERAWDAYGRGDCETASGHARQALQIDRHNGRAWFVLACTQERQGRFRAADRAFLQATKAPHEPQPPPYRAHWRHYLRAVQQAAEALPAELQQRLEEVEIALANHPTPEQVLAADNPEVLGFFTGPTRSRRQESHEPPRIHLFRRAHEHCTSTVREFDAEVRRTLYHELGHYLEFDADDMARFDLL